MLNKVDIFDKLTDIDILIVFLLFFAGLCLLIWLKPEWFSDITLYILDKYEKEINELYEKAVEELVNEGYKMTADIFGYMKIRKISVIRIATALGFNNFSEEKTKEYIKNLFKDYGKEKINECRTL